jgi:general stress protein YciG
METCPKCGTVQDPEHPVCVHMVGRKGGREVAKRGPEFYAAIGQKGGATNFARHGAEAMRAIGKRGGDATKASGLDYSAIGKLGGAATKALGPEHYAALGRKGGARLRALVRRGRQAEGPWEPEVEVTVREREAKP